MSKFKMAMWKLKELSSDRHVHFHTLYTVVSNSLENWGILYACEWCPTQSKFHFVFDSVCVWKNTVRWKSVGTEALPKTRGFSSSLYSLGLQKNKLTCFVSLGGHHN